MSEEHDYGQYYTFSSGIKCLVLPFPSLRFDRFLTQARKKFPLPKPPKKKIKVVDGEEEIDDIKNEKYLASKEKAEKQQERFISEKVLKVCLRDCIELDLSEYEHIISVLEDDNEEPYPENPLERKVLFLTEYVIRSAGDFQAITKIATDLMRIDESEVDDQLDSFQDNME